MVPIEKRKKKERNLDFVKGKTKKMIEIYTQMILYTST